MEITIEQFNNFNFSITLYSSNISKIEFILIELKQAIVNSKLLSRFTVTVYNKGMPSKRFTFKTLDSALIKYNEILKNINYVK